MIDLQIELPDTPRIPRLVFRAFDPGRDYEGFVAVLREANVADGVDWLPNVETVRHDHAHTDEFDPRRDILVAEVDGALIAAAQADVRTRDGGATHEIEGWVVPAWRRRGIGSAMLGWTERRAAEVARVDGRRGQRALVAWPDEQQVGAVALYERASYRIVRYGFQMSRDLREPIPDLGLPAGLEIRPVVAADHRRIWDADVEAFLDHWDPAIRTEANFERWFTSPELDTSLWRVAWDGDEVAGSVMNFIYADENEALGVRRGWLEHVSVRRPWRRRGVAAALIAESLRVLRDVGLDEGGLGVDADNPNGALHLYESLGFVPVRTGVSYRKEFAID